MLNPITLNHFGRRTAFIQMLKDRGAKIGVEIGTDRGKYAQELCEGIPGLILYCVDPWIPYKEGNQVHDQAEVDKIYEKAKGRLVKYNCRILKKTSIEAVDIFQDGMLDFVFIDGNHEYNHVLEDITQWTKKVKPGGIVAGHDYTENKECNYGVIEAVNKYTEDNHINPWFILHGGGQLTDCWMFIR